MKRKICEKILVFAVASFVLCGCGSRAKTDITPVDDSVNKMQDDADGNAEEVTDDTVDNELANIGNPWEDSDRDDILASIGVVMDVPEGSSDVLYQKNMSEGIGQVVFTYGEPSLEYTYRIKSTDGFEDISGLYYEWDVDDEGEFGYCPSQSRRALSDGEMIVSLLWYDVVPGFMYSLSTQASDLDGFDIQAVAQMVYVHMQSEEEFIPSNFLESGLMSDEFSSYDDIISKLSKGNGYAYINVLGCDEELLVITEGTYDNLDGNMVTIDASVYMEKDGRAKCVGNVISSGTAYPISLSDDGKIYSGGNHEVNISCICPQTDGVMNLVYAYETFDEEGNATYGGFIRDKASLEDDGASIAEDDSSILPRLYEEYSLTKPINFTVVQ